MADPEDLLSDSLQTLYDYTPIVRSFAGQDFVYRCPLSQWYHISSTLSSPPTITLRTPDTQPANWSLHASSIWIASVDIANNLCELGLDRHLASRGEPLRVLELGAGAGLPGILIAKCYEHVRVVSSDYPDDNLVRTLAENVTQNHVSDRCRVVPYAWGSDPSALFSEVGDADGQSAPGFDVIIAADTLWNPELHQPFIQSLRLTLKRSTDARIYLAAGQHTGCYTIEAFMKLAVDSGFEIEAAEEKMVHGWTKWPWSVDVAETRDEQERRRWVVWISLRWKSV